MRTYVSISENIGSIGLRLIKTNRIKNKKYPLVLRNNLPFSVAIPRE
jgi:hypothetical protein